jgi:PAS domain S-box-containing protein
MHATSPVLATVPSRAAALHPYGILDTPPEKEFDALTRLAAYVAGTPIAFIGFVDGERQWYKSQVGVTVTEMPVEQVFCRYTVRGQELLEIVNARLDDRFSRDRIVTEGHLRYYCGLPLLTPEGFRVGTLCVSDLVPRSLDESQKEALGSLAREVMTRLELRRKQQELEEQKRQLKRSEAQYRALFEESEGYLFSHTLGGKILHGNPAAVQALGHRAEELVGKDIAQLLVVGHSSQLDHYLNALRAGRTVSGVSRVITAAGEERYWQYRNFPSVTAGGEPYVICSAHDVTDKELSAKLLREAKEELSEQVQLRTEELQASNSALLATRAELDVFLYQASHDLKGPLCSMEGLLDLGQLEEDPAQQRAYFPMMQQTVGKLNRVLESLLSYTKNTHHGVARERIQFGPLLEETLAGLRGTKGFERVKIKTYFDALSPFYSDAERVLTVLKNLVGNSITFQNYDLEEPTVHIWINCTPREAVVVVRDNGVGMSEGEQAEVFRMFSRSSSQSTGSGLGLFVTGEIVKKLDGHISLQSEPGKGTQVTVRLPSLVEVGS